MPYDAITIDTNTIKSLGFRFEAGLLGQFTQFNGGATTFILSDVVAREIRKHLVVQTNSDRDAALKALDRLKPMGLLPENHLLHKDALLGGILDANAAADQRITDFLSSSGAVGVSAGLCSAEEVMTNYFEGKPPFEESGPKKHEFPDAVALLSLQKWAETTGKKVLAVSSDKGWAEFAKGSDYIDVEPDLGKALATLQMHTDGAMKTALALLSKAENGSLPDIRETIEEQLGDLLREWEWDAEGHSAYYYELDSTDIDLDGFGFSRNGQFDLSIVRMGSNEIVVQVEVDVSAVAHAEFSLSVYDSIDKDMVSMGSVSLAKDVEFVATLLITIAGDATGDIEQLEVHEVELVDALGSVDFGEIDHDHGDYEQ